MFIKKLMLIPAMLVVGMSSLSSQEVTSYFWEFNSLETIGGNTLEYTGTPEVVDTDLGKAIRFDSKSKERVLIDANPIGDAKEFTVEVVFNADAGSENQNNDPRFVHIQSSDDDTRVMMEIRVNDQDQVYLDGFIKTDKENLPLIDETKVHETEVWNHAAISYKDGVFKTYFNGVQELSGDLAYTNKIVSTTGSTSVGARMNERNYYSGMVKCLKITHKELSAGEFLVIDSLRIDKDPGTGTKISSLAVANKELKVYPIPANDKLVIDFLKNKYINNIEIISLSGVTVKNESIVGEMSGQLNIDVSGIREGFYILKINSENDSVVRRISISR